MTHAAKRRKSSPRHHEPAQPGAATPVPVVAVGASAGGLEPISQFLAALPADAGLAVVVIQHLDPTSKSMLPELLARRSTLAVSLATDGVLLQPNRVYVIPPAVFLSISSGRLRFTPAKIGKGARMPIDVFLHSLAADRGRRGIGIIMSGTGTDGAEGLKALKRSGRPGPGAGPERSAAGRYAAERHGHGKTRLRSLRPGHAGYPRAVCYARLRQGTASTVLHAGGSGRQRPTSSCRWSKY